MIVTIEFLFSIRDVAGEATIDLYMTEMWKDSREKFTNLKQHSKNNSKIYASESIRMSGPGVVNYCWIPDTYFILARSIFYSPSSLSLQVSDNGEVMLDRKVRLVTPCKPQVKYFPFDVTTCRILISSYGFDASELYLAWERENGEGVSFPFEYEPLSEMGFKILNMSSTCFYATYSGYTFTILEGVVHLERLYTVYIYQIYIPAALLVVLSWVTFWINKGATPARASVGVTTVLTMLTLATQSQQNMEKHITLETSLLDIYIWVCFSFVIAAMLEFAMSDFLNDKASRKSKKLLQDLQVTRENTQVEFGNGADDSLLNNNDIGIKPRTSRSAARRKSSMRPPKPKTEQIISRLDKIARVLFPVVFVIFNMCYWSYVAYILMNSSYGESHSGKMNAEPCAEHPPSHN